MSFALFSLLADQDLKSPGGYDDRISIGRLPHRLKRFIQSSGVIGNCIS
jgi:hypothetical protein